MQLLKVNPLIASKVVSLILFCDKVDVTAYEEIGFPPTLSTSDKATLWSELVRFYDLTPCTDLCPVFFMSCSSTPSQ